MSSQQAYYYRVGVFVFSGIALVTLFVLVLVGGDFFAERRIFETYFDESVQGLSVGSAVTFRGVQIGSVSRIGLVGDYYELTPEQDLTYGQRILVRASVVQVDPDVDTRREAIRRIQALANRGLRLRLTASLLTGQAFLEADFVDPEQHPEMDIVWEPGELYIPSAPSQMATISSAAERIAQRLEALDIQRLFDHVDELVVGVTQAVDDLRTDEIGLELASLLSELRVTNARIGTAVEQADIDELSDDLEAGLEQLTRTLSHAQHMIDSGRYDFEVALENMRVASENIRAVTETAKSFPSVLLRGSEPVPIDVSAP